MKQQEEGRKSAEDKERERRTKFMEDWKRKVERKKKQERVQKGRKDLLESVEEWGELQEGESENENLEDWFAEEWTEDGFQEAGEVLEAVLTDVLAFIEMSGTVQTNNYHQTNIAECSNQSLQEPGLVAESERLENAEVSEAVPPIQPNREKSL